MTTLFGAVGELPLRVTRTSLHAPLEVRCRCGLGRPTATDAALIRMALHAAACERGSAQMLADPSPLTGEQAVRIVRRRGRMALVCVCGAEAGWWRYGSHSQSVRLKEHWRRPEAGADLTLEGLGSLLRHTGSCAAAQTLAEGGQADGT